MVESLLGAPVVKEATGLGSTAPRVRLFWENWCRPEISQTAIPTNILLTPSLKTI